MSRPVDHVTLHLKTYEVAGEIVLFGIRDSNLLLWVGVVLMCRGPLQRKALRILLYPFLTLRQDLSLNLRPDVYSDNGRWPVSVSHRARDVGWSTH